MKSVKIVSLLLAILMLLSLCACGAKTGTASEPVPAGPVPESSEENSPVAEPEADFTTGRPWLASSLEGVVTEDTPTSLKDDYYLYVNKDDILNLEIPAGYSSAGLITDVIIQTSEDIQALFTDDTSAVSHDGQLAKTFYDLFLDWDTRNALGVSPLKEEIDSVEKITTLEELNSYFLSTSPEEILFLPVTIGSFQDLDDSRNYILAINSGSLLLEDSAEYSNLTEHGTVVKEATDDCVLYLLSRLGYSEEESSKKLENCYAFERMLAPSIFTSSDQNQPDYTSKINNHITYEELESLQGSFPITKLADCFGYVRKDFVLLFAPKWLAVFSEAYTEDNLELIKDYMIVHGAISESATLDRDCYDKSIEYLQKIYGSSGTRTDEAYAADTTSGVLKWQVARLYCDKYVTAEKKEAVLTLCNDIKSAYEELLLSADFLSEETRQKAVEKLRAMTVNALYPDDWAPYSYDQLELASGEEGGTYYEAVKKVNREVLRKRTEQFAAPVDRSVWSSLDIPTAVNAYYSLQNNSFTILAAFCSGDMYNEEMSYEEMCGKIGLVIGHEISHSFDGTGSRFDKDGNYDDWWTEGDRAAFDSKIQAIADYSSTISCWEGTNIDGSIITGEACADMGGVAVILQIAKSRKDFDYDRFFHSYAEMHSEIMTYNYFLSILKDEHPPAFYRVNAVLQQFDEFLDCYGIEEGDSMYLAPENRIAIW